MADPVNAIAGLAGATSKRVAMHADRVNAIARHEIAAADHEIVLAQRESTPAHCKGSPAGDDPKARASSWTPVVATATRRRHTVPGDEPVGLWSNPVSVTVGG